jgi:hypothetical protein
LSAVIGVIADLAAISRNMASANTANYFAAPEAASSDVRPRRTDLAPHQLRQARLVLI